MRDRLFSLFWEDRPSRVKMYVFVLCTSLILGLLLMINGRGQEEITNDVVILAVATIVFRTLVYCVFPTSWARCTVMALRFTS